MKKPLNHSTELYLILDEYLTDFQNRFNKIKKERDDMLIILSDLNLRIEKNPTQNLIEAGSEIAKECKIISKNFDIHIAKLRKIGIFIVDLALDNIKKDNEIFNDIILHFSKREEFETCSKLKSIISDYFEY